MMKQLTTQLTQQLTTQPAKKAASRAATKAARRVMQRMETRFVKGANVRRSEVEGTTWRSGRRSGGAGVWESTGVPATVRSDGWMPVAATWLPGVGRRVVWLEDGAALGYALAEPSAAIEQWSAVTLGTLEGRLLRVESAGEGVLRLELEDARSVYVAYDAAGALTLLGAMPQLPWLGFTVGDERTFSEPLRRVTLSGGSNVVTHSLLCEEDCRRISAESVAAYTRLRLRGEALGYQMQPRMVRYRLVDGAGGTVVRGPWVLLSGTMGLQLTGDLSATSTDSLATMTGGVVQLRGFKVTAPTLPTLPSPWGKVVKSVEVEWGPSIDPVNPAGVGSAMGSGNGQTIALTYRLPTFTREELERVVTDTIGASLSTDLPHPVRDAVMHRAVAECSGRVLRGGERVMAYHGCGLRAVAQRCANVAWHGLTEVIIGSGDAQHTAVVSDMAPTAAPEQLSALLWYPHPRARELRVTIKRGSADTVQQTYVLTPSPCGRFAYWLAPDWGGTTPSTPLASMPAAPASGAVGSERRGVVKVMEEERVTDEATVDPAGLTAIAGASRSRSGWDFSRARALVFGRSGSRLIVLDGAGRIHSVGELDRRPVGSSRSVAEISADDGLTHLVAAGGDLLEVGINRVATLVRGCAAVEVGWCGLWSEYWWSTSVGRLMRCHALRPHERVEVKSAVLSGAPRLRMWEGELLVGSATGHPVGVASRNSYPTDGAAMELTERADAAMLPGGITPVTFHLSGGSLRGSVGLWGDRNTGVAEKLLALKVEGAVNAPLTAMMAAPPRLAAETHLSLTVKAPARWAGVQL